MQQVAVQSSPRLGSYLQCPTPSLQEALARQAELPTSARKRLGDLLVEARTISAEELRACLEVQRVDRLRRCALFANFPRSDLVQLSTAFEELTVEAGTQFITEGDFDFRLFIVASGELEVFHTDEQGDEVSIARVYPGEPVGELGYVTGGRRTASVRALKRCELLGTEYDAFRTLLDAMPRLSQAFLDIAVRRLIHTSELFADRQQRLKTVEHSLHELTDLLDLSGGDAGIEGLLERLARTVRLMLGAERGSLYLLDHETGELWSKVGETAGTREIRIPAGTGIPGWVAEHKEALNITEPCQDYRFDLETDQWPGSRTDAVLCAPIWSPANVLLGVVQVVNKREGGFNSHDETLLRAFTSQAAIALENFNLHGKMVESNRAMAILLELANAIGNTLDIQKLIRKVVDRITEALQCERSSFFVVDENAGELWSMEFQGEELEEIRFPISSGLAGECATKSEAILVDDAYADPRFNQDIDRATGFRTRSILCMPVINRDRRTTGVIECMNKIQGGFSGDDMKLLRALSAQVSVALDNAHLHAREVEIRRYLEQVQETISNGILTLDESWGIVVCNRAAERLLGTPDAERMDLRDILGDAAPDFLAAVDEAYRSRCTVNRDELTLRHADGSHSTINAGIAPLVDADGLFKGLVLVLDDISREKRVRSAFGQYLAPAVIEELLADPDKLRLGGEKRELTAMFTDIEGFTTLTEGVDPESLVSLLHDYFDMACAIVLRHGGTIDKIVGDALHVIFNAPVQVEDHAARAVRCALELAQHAERLASQQSERGLALGRTRIGINTGMCVVGNFGGSARFDYTAHGDTINTAARLEGANKHLGTVICVSEATMTRCGPEIGFRPIGRLRLKGKQELIAVFEPLAEGEAVSTRATAYLEAYDSLADPGADAAAKFQQLAGEFPDDPLIRLHVRRLAEGAAGDEMVLESK